MAEAYKIAAVKSKISIPMYFYNIIVHQRADYYSDYNVDFDARPVAKCPLHDEDTPSMRFYEDTNTFYCFGCRAGGDVIQLHRKFTERMTDVFPSFDDSIEFLYDFFIKGNESAKTIKTRGKLTEAEQQSSVVEVARYTNYSALIEGQLDGDTSIKQEAKEKIWKALDDVDLLVSENLVNAIDGMNYIKGVVRQSIT